jgi:hypothetical protein
MSKIDEDMESSFGFVVRNLQQTLENRIDFERSLQSQQQIIGMNRVAKDQKKDVSKAVKQIRAANSLGLNIDLENLLLTKAKAKSIMDMWIEALAESDSDKAERFKEECSDWAEKVVQSVDRSWKDKCTNLLQAIKRHSGLLRTLNKFKNYEIEYATMHDRLEIKSQSHAYLSKVEDISEVMAFIEKLEKEIVDLGSLPEGLLEFMDRVNSDGGVPYLTFFNSNEDQIAIRTWLEENGFLSQLILKARV